MIPRIKYINPMDDYKLHVVFDDGKAVLYDVKDDIRDIPSYSDLKTIYGLFQQVQLDQSRTCVFWNDYIDLASDSIYEYGKELGEFTEVMEFKLLDEKTMLLTFQNGEKRDFDATVLTGPAFEPLKDPKIFGAAEIDNGVITWMGGEIDIAPEFMYVHSTPHSDYTI